MKYVSNRCTTEGRDYTLFEGAETLRELSRATTPDAYPFKFRAGEMLGKVQGKRRALTEIFEAYKVDILTYSTAREDKKN